MTFVDRVSRLLWATGLVRSATPGPLILMYHGLGGPDGVASEDFEAQLRRLAARRRIVPLSDAIDRLGTPGASEVAAVTFDDGYRDFATLAVPVLERLDLCATLFVPAGHLGGWNVWDEGRAERREILTRQEIRDLAPRHVTIGAHGFSHCRLAGLDDSALRRETRGARALLEEACGRPVELFAYPYGQLDDFDARAESAVADAGFKGACSTWFGRGSKPDQRFRLRRVGIRSTDSLDTVAYRLDGAYDWTGWKEIAGHRGRSLVRPTLRASPPTRTS